MYYRDAQLAILVYAVDVPETLTKLKGWIDKLQADTTIMPIMIIVGNKTDLERKVPYPEGEAFAHEEGGIYCECSAKEDIGIRELFTLAAEKALATKPMRAGERHSSDVVEPVEGEKRACC
jgi:GTPase SAR1 family protein